MYTDIEHKTVRSNVTQKSTEKVHTIQKTAPGRMCEMVCIWRYAKHN